MLSLAPWRYRSVLDGPIDKVDLTPISFFGKRRWMARAWLKEEIVPPQYSSDDGRPTGAAISDDKLSARFSAISESIERWAFYSIRENQPTSFGLDADGSTNGMAAFPGVGRGAARKNAYREAAERFCQSSWWDRRLCHELIREPLPEGVQGIELENPFTDHSVTILWHAMPQSHCVYGVGAGADTRDAVGRALAELWRSRRYVNYLLEVSGGLIDDALIAEGRDLLDRRLRYYASPPGYALFLERLEQTTSKPLGSFEVVFDGEIPGPWSKYATVWRVATKPAHPEFLDSSSMFFFW